MSEAPAPQAPPKQNRPVLDEYRSLGIVTFPLPGNEELVFSENNGSARVLSSLDVDILFGCRDFRTLQDHAHEICAALNIPAADVAPVLYQLAQFAKAGFLVSRRQLAAPPGTADDPPPIASLGVVTRDRIVSLERCLAGYMENARTHGRPCRFVVMDDSGEPGARERTREMLSTLKSRFGARLAYAGQEEKRLFRDALAREAGCPDVIEFALGDPEGCGHSPGANRNALLLDTVGEMFLSVDDDTVCRMTAPPQGSDAPLALSSEGDPTDTWCYPDRDTALKAAGFADRDFIGTHAELLGKGVSRCVTDADARGKVDFDAMDARFLRMIRSGRGRVRITQCGLVGDCALGSILWLTTLRGRSLERLGPEAEYRAACSSREIIRAVRMPTLSNQTFLMTFGAGFDHRDPLPPFMPVMRFEDGLFALALRKCLDHASIGHLPWSVLHAPPEARTFQGQQMTRLASQVFLHDILTVSMQSLEMGFAKPEGKDRFRALGRHLSELGALPLRDFEEIIRRLLWMDRCTWIESLDAEAAKQEKSAPAWAADVRRTTAEVRKSLPLEEFIVPDDLRKGRDPVQARELSKRLVSRFGKQLETWPDVIDAARALRAKGVTVSREI